MSLFLVIHIDQHLHTFFSVNMVQEMKEEEEKEASKLQQASILINSLIPSTYPIHSFTGKWHSIRNKLEKLSSSLTSCTINSNFNCSELDLLLEAITSTSNQIQLLVDQCIDSSYSQGKLRLRSDLDMVLSILDVHIRNLDEIYACGILTQNRAIILSRPGLSATREDMKLYIRDIFTRLKVGGSEFKMQALVSLNQIFQEDDKYIKIAVATDMIDDDINLLVNSLEFGTTSIQEEASKAILVLSEFDSCKGSLANAGVIGALIRLLDTGSELGKEYACNSLEKMTENSENSWSVSAQGGVSILLKILKNPNCKKDLIISVFGVLRNISGVNEVKQFMIDEGAISVFKQLLSSNEELIQIQAVEFLIALASSDKSIVLVDSLVGVLDPSSILSSKVIEIALRAIENLYFSSTNFIDVLISSGYIDKLSCCLRNAETSLVQESALKSVSKLCFISEDAKRVMGDLGFMNELVKLLENKSYEVRELAAESLCNLISVQRNRRKFAQADYNVNKVLQLLNPEDEKTVSVKKLLLSTLLILTDSNSCKKKIMASGYVKNVEKLAENGVIEAKKIVKKLSSNRLQNILHGIWSS